MAETIKGATIAPRIWLSQRNWLSRFLLFCSYRSFYAPPCEKRLQHIEKISGIQPDVVVKPIHSVSSSL